MGRLIKNYSSGQVIVELLVAFGLAAVLLPALLTGLIAGRTGKVQQQQRTLAVGYLREAEEVVRNVREADWKNISDLTNFGSYHPMVTSDCVTSGGTVWKLCPGADHPGNGDFTRSIVVTDATPQDPSFKKVTITVTWNNILPTSETSTIYLARWKNLSFSPVTAGGQLYGQGFGDWCNPSSTPAAQLNLTGGLNVVSVAQGSGNVISFVGSGNSANGMTYADLNITDPNHPTAPVPSVLGTVSNSPQIKTNGAFNDVSFGYLAADQHGGSGQGLIIDLSKIVSDPTHSIVGTLDIGSSKNGQSVYVSNATNIAYLTATDGYIYAFDVSTKTGSHSPIGGSKIQLAGVGKKIVAIGTNVYVATDSTTNQFQIIDFSVPGAPKVAASVNVGNGKGGVDVYIDPIRMRAYLVTAYASATVPDFFTIDVNPGDAWYKQIINTFITTNNMNPTGVAAVTAKRAIIVGKGSTRNYQVIDDSNENVPAPALSTCGAGGINASYDIYGIATQFTNAQRAYSYIITADSGVEYKIIEGGPGGAGGGNMGTFESNIFDCRTATPACTTPVIFNKFLEVPSPSPSGVTTNYQVAVSTDCTTFNYTGSFGSSGGVIPLLINPGYCFRYKVTFTNAGVATNASTSVTVNYSP